MDYSKLPTEKQNPKTRSLDTLSPEEILALMDEEDGKIAAAVKKVNPAIARAAKQVAVVLKKGGRVFLYGAGTSGRLGVLEAAECPPTFNTPPSLIQAVMAGGNRSVFRSKEGAEDSGEEARREVKRRVRKGDIVIGISASGVTPFVREALLQAKRRGAETLLIACNFSSPLRRLADILIMPQTGPEVIAGSTRLKAGTATKLILNRITVASMVQLGKVYGNRMVDLQPRSKKLRARAIQILKQLAGVRTERKAKRLFDKAKGRVKVAILMGRRRLSYRQAIHLLKKTNGFLRRALMLRGPQASLGRTPMSAPINRSRDGSPPAGRRLPAGRQGQALRRRQSLRFAQGLVPLRFRLRGLEKACCFGNPGQSHP